MWKYYIVTLWSKKFSQIQYYLKFSACLTEKNCVSVTKTSKWMMFRKIISFILRVVWHINTLCVQNAEIFSKCVSSMKWGLNDMCVTAIICVCLSVCYSLCYISMWYLSNKLLINLLMYVTRSLRPWGVYLFTSQGLSLKLLWIPIWMD